MATCGEGTPDELEIHRAARPLGVRIPRPPPLFQEVTRSLPSTSFSLACMSRYSQMLRVSLGLPLPAKMRMSSAISGPQASAWGELQGLDANLVALASARGALDDVDQLADVARPAIAAQARLGIAGQAEHSAVTAGEPICEVAR